MHTLATELMTHFVKIKIVSWIPVSSIIYHSTLYSIHTFQVEWEAVTYREWNTIGRKWKTAENMPALVS